MSEVSLSEMRLCRLNGVPPGERLTGVLRSSDLQPFLILLRSSSFAWLCGVLGFFVVDVLLFLKRFLDPFSAVALLVVSGVRGGGGGGGGISICGGRGAVGTQPELFVVTSMLFLLQYFPTCWYTFARFRFRMASFGLVKLNVPRVSRI